MDPQVVARGDLLGFWPFLGGGHLEKFRARFKNRNARFPGAKGTFGGRIRPPQKFLPKIAQLFYILRFGRADPQGREIAKYGFSGPFWPRAALGTWGNSGPGSKTDKRDFPERGAHLGGKSVRPKGFFPKLRNFFTFLADRTPRGGES